MRLSIITINRNNSEGLRKTMESVFNQSFKEMEYIIVDGASTDDSVNIANEIIRKQTAIPHDRVLFSSEHDSGIYNAMNKGIAKASGDYLLFLNSGDIINHETSLVEAFSCIKTDPDIILGHVRFVKNGKEISPDVGWKPGEELSLYGIYLFGVAHQGSLIKKKLFDRHPYDENMRINSDWKFFVETIVIDNVPIELIPTVIADYDLSGISSRNTELMRKERLQNFREVVPARIAIDYEKVFPYYQECKRVSWLISHRLFYWIYRGITSIGMRLFK